MKVQPRKLDRAEIAFRQAFDAGCRRGELVDDWFEALVEKGDWNAAVRIANLGHESLSYGRFIFLKAVAQLELGKLVLGSGAISSAMEKFLAAGRLANDAFLSRDISGLYEEVIALRRECYLSAVDLGKRVFSTDSSGIELFELAVEAFDAFVRTRSIVDTMAVSLQAWANNVVSMRDGFNVITFNKMNSAIAAINDVFAEMVERSWSDHAVLARVEDCVAAMPAIRDRYEERSG